MTISPTRFAAFVMLERVISVVDVVGVDGLPPSLPRSEYVFAAVWASGADVAAVYGASSSWSTDLFIADFDAVLYHGSFFADLATRLKELATACRAQGCRVIAPGAVPRHIQSHGLKVIEIPPWFDQAEALLPPPRASRAAGSVLPADDRQDGDPPPGRGVELQSADDRVEAALQGAFLAAISLKFDHQLSSKPKLRA